MSERELVLVGDLGGTNCRVGVANADEVLERRFIDTPTDPDQLFHELGMALRHFAERYEVTKGAIGMPGPVRLVDGDYQVGPFNNVAGIDEPFNLEERLTAEHSSLSGMSLLPLNDADAATHAAAHLYAKNHNQQPLTFLTISTGVGGATIQDYVVRRELGEYGHMPLFLDGGKNYSTLEDRVSGKSISRRFGRGEVSAEELYARPATDYIWKCVGEDLAYAIGVLVPVEGMEQVVIGGGVGANCNQRFGTVLKEELDKVITAMPANLAQTPEVTYVPPDLDKVIGLRGCYYAALQRRD